jgi:hypothetical protein
MKLASVFLSALLLISTSVLVAQDNSSSGNQQSTQSQSNTRTDQNVSGTISKDGRSFTSDRDNKTYPVNNPDALKGHEGEHVMLVVHVDPDTGVIHVAQVAVPPQQQ